MTVVLKLKLRIFQEKTKEKVNIPNQGPIVHKYIVLPTSQLVLLFQIFGFTHLNTSLVEK